MMNPIFIALILILAVVLIIAVVCVIKVKNSMNTGDIAYESIAIKNSVRKCCTPEPGSESFKEIDEAIKRSIVNTDSVEVYYQPIYSVKHSKVAAAEALLRINDTELGEISPEEFIPVSEETGDIVDLGHIMLEKVCQLLKKEEAQKQGIKYIEINMSALECERRELYDEITSIVDKYGIDISQINIEIKESTLRHKNPVLAENMDRLNDLGMCFSLDDYGTGNAAMAYIITFPFYIIKIDRGMLWNAVENERAMMALCASINLIKDMNMKIVVEGVESQEMVDKLKILGCDFLQGYYFSKPIPEKEFMEYIRRENTGE